jgi:hypothetical protein
VRGEKVSRINGYFAINFGYVKAQLLILDLPYVAPIKFSPKIDTGADTTVIFDSDFLNLCSCLGCNVKYNFIDLLNWIYLKDQIFEEDDKILTCPSGPLEGVFKIKGSYLSLEANGKNISLLDDNIEPVRCSFSKSFMTANWTNRNNQSHDSLLGTCHMNALKKFTWEYANKRIVLKK